MKFIRSALFIILIAYVAIVALAFIVQRSLIYFPPDIYHAPPDWLTEVRTADNSLGWYGPARDDSAPVVMVFHGNASSIDSNLHIFRDLRAQGYGVWSVGYPGYPGTQGKATEGHLVASAQVQYDRLIESGIPPDRIVFYGSSLGAGVAAQLARTRRPRLLILDAPFHSALDQAKRQMKALPLRWLMRDQWRSDLALTEIASDGVPLLWIHGDRDNILPLSEGQRLYDGYTGPKTFAVIQGAHHTNTWRRGGGSFVMEALARLRKPVEITATP